MKLDIFTSSLVLVLPINVIFGVKVEHGARLNDVTKHSVTESTELNPGCQQPFLFDKRSSAAKTPAAKKSAGSQN
jgi:hypothetical protein